MRRGGIGEVLTDGLAEVVDQRLFGQRRGLGTIVLGELGDGLQAIIDHLAGHERRGEIVLDPDPIPAVRTRSSSDNISSVRPASQSFHWPSNAAICPDDRCRAHGATRP